MNLICELNEILTLTAGDHFELPVFINAGTKMCPLRYILTDDDSLLVSIMEPNKPFECGVIRKILTKKDLNAYGDAVLKLDFTDTQNVLPGVYYIEIKLKSYEGTHSDNNLRYETIVPPRKFIIQ